MTRAPVGGPTRFGEIRVLVRGATGRRKNGARNAQGQHKPPNIVGPTWACERLSRRSASRRVGDAPDAPHPSAALQRSSKDLRIIDLRSSDSSAAIVRRRVTDKQPATAPKPDDRPPSIAACDPPSAHPSRTISAAKPIPRLTFCVARLCFCGVRLITPSGLAALGVRPVFSGFFGIFPAAMAIVHSTCDCVQLRERSVPNNPITWMATPFFHRTHAATAKMRTFVRAMQREAARQIAASRDERAKLLLSLRRRRRWLSRSFALPCPVSLPFETEPTSVSARTTSRAGGGRLDDDAHESTGLRNGRLACRRLDGVDLPRRRRRPAGRSATRTARRRSTELSPLSVRLCCIPGFAAHVDDPLRHVPRRAEQLRMIGLRPHREDAARLGGNRHVEPLVDRAAALVRPVVERLVLGVRVEADALERFVERAAPRRPS